MVGEFDAELATKEFLDRNFSEGDVVSHAAINDILNLDLDCKGGFERLSRLDALRKRLREYHNIVFENVKSVGYLIVPQRNHAAYAIRKAEAEMQRTFKRSDEIISCTDMNKLTREEQANHHDLKRRFESFKEGVQYQRLDNFAACSKLLGYSD